MIDQVSAGLQELSDDILKYALVIAAVGTISMALVDVIKGLFRIKGYFLRQMTRSWIIDRDARNDLIYLASGQNESSTPLVWWDQPSQKVFDQFRAAAEIAVDFPNDYSSLYKFLTDGVNDSVTWKNTADNFRLGSVETNPTSASRLADLHAQLSRMVSKKLDTLQVMFEWYSVKMSQVAAFLVSLILLLVLFLRGNAGFFEALCVGILAGCLAPFAKDLVSRVSEVQIRRRF
jgi:hypothetical protein